MSPPQPESQRRSYQHAIECLNSLQSNASTIAQIRQNQSTRNDLIIPESLDYLRRIGYTPADLNPLNVIHITGTKGKGSTSAFCSSLLLSLPTPTSTPGRKVGLYTSPHMVAVRERIRINGRPIEEDMFARYFFEVWDRFESNPKEIPSATDKPAYFRFMTMLAYHVFLQEKVDATILEVGIGGLYDSTNLVPRPLATGMSALGIDHVAVLGKTLGEIAWQKSGIFKPGVPALSVEQPTEGMMVLKDRAEELKASEFRVIPLDPSLSSLKLGLAGIHQRSNASLALALVRAFLASPYLPSSSPFHSSNLRLAPSPSTSSSSSSAPAAASSAAGAGAGARAGAGVGAAGADDLEPYLRKGLENAHWPGRCQVVRDRDPNLAGDGDADSHQIGRNGDGANGNGESAHAATGTGVTWYLDGAHTVESLAVCGEWFRETAIAKTSAPSSPRRTLVFNCTSGRSGPSLLGQLLASVSLPTPTSTSTSISTAAGTNDSPGTVSHSQGHGPTSAGKDPIFDQVIFCTNATYASGVFKSDLTSALISSDDLANLPVQNELAEAWKELGAGAGGDVHVVPSIQHAVDIVRSSVGDGIGDDERGKGQGRQVLVTGSLHLVGGVMEVAGLKHAL